MMTYKETLFFIGKCLTISHEKKNYEEVELELQSGKIDWDQVVKVSTGQFVFPALYCNLKRVKFLHYLPKDLVEYMEHITNLNRERNQQIIEQAKEINELLLSNNITPIFLKGTGNLLEGLYEDIAERMVGDIDILVSKSDYNITIKKLKKNGYKKKDDVFFEDIIFSRHYPRITKKGKIAAIEIHHKMITQENHFSVNDNFKKTAENINVLSNKDQISMTCFNKQFNDKGQWYKTISLRNSYDLFLLSKLTSVKEALNYFSSSTFCYLNNFVASCSMIFNHPKSLDHISTSKTNKFINKQLYFLKFPKRIYFNKKKWDIYFLYKKRFLIIIKSLYKKKYFNHTVSRLLNHKWYKRKLGL